MQRRRLVPSRCARRALCSTFHPFALTARNQLFLFLLSLRHLPTALQVGDVLMGVGADAVRPKSHKELLKLLARLRADAAERKANERAGGSGGSGGGKKVKGASAGGSSGGGAGGAAVPQPMLEVRLYRTRRLPAAAAARLAPPPFGLGVAHLGLGGNQMLQLGGSSGGLERIPGVSALVLDSPFGSVYELAWDMVALAKKETEMYAATCLRCCLFSLQLILYSYT